MVISVKVRPTRMSVPVNGISPLRFGGGRVRAPAPIMSESPPETLPLSRPRLGGVGVYVRSVCVRCMLPRIHVDEHSGDHCGKEEDSCHPKNWPWHIRAPSPWSAPRFSLVRGQVRRCRGGSDRVEQGGPDGAPICCDVFVMAEVTPTSLGSAFWVAVLMQGTMASPSPCRGAIRSAGRGSSRRRRGSRS